MEPVNSKVRHRAVICIMAALNAASLVAATNLTFALNPEERVSVRRGLVLTALGMVYFTTLFELINAAALFTSAGAKFRHKYRLSCGDVLDISNKLVSAIQALLSCVAGVIVCSYSCTRDMQRTSHVMSDAYAWFGAAYFFYDIWSMYMVHIQMTSPTDYYMTKLHALLAGDSALCSGDAGAGAKASFLSYCKSEPIILMHHLFIGGFGFSVIVYLRGSLGDCVFGFVYLMELSTPFVSLRGILSRLQLKASQAYLVNGLLMLGSFFLCRVVSLPYVCLMYARATGKGYFEAIGSLPTGCKVSICILLLPQMYWFYLMSAGAVKVFFGPTKDNKKSVSVSKSDGTSRIQGRSSKVMSTVDVMKRS